MTRLGLVLALAICPIAPSQAGQSGARMFPPDMDYDPGLLQRLNEPPLWSSGDARWYNDRIRLSITGINRLRIVIRIDVAKNGEGSGTFISAYHPMRGGITIERRSFALPRASMRELYARIDKSGLWRQPRQGWSMAGDDNICIDGEELLFERMDSTGYRAAAANAQCTAPREVLDLASAIIETSGEDAPQRLLW